MPQLEKLELTLGAKFRNRDILKEALTHRSYLNENPSWSFPHNERLEFLGDAVLELIITEAIYEKYPAFDEGKLTSIRAALVNYVMLSKVAREINLEKFIFLSKGESNDTKKAHGIILANAFEALIGALYLDQGTRIVKRVILNFVLSHLDEVMTNGLYRDSKSALQEYVQEKMKTTPIYRVLKEEGPDHEKIFKVGVFLGEKLLGEGEGSFKQEAESRAAEEALASLGYGK
ncbi:MAG: ribonuclease III [Patescibacteria group bacterium]